MIFGINTTREITYNNFEISLVEFMPNVTTNHAITYTNKCIVQVKNHLRRCNLSRTEVTEYDLILARAGKFNRSHE